MAKDPKELRNPLTKQPPNSYTNVTNRELDTPHTGVRPSPMPAPDQRRLRQAHVEATRPGGVADARLGYGATGGMSPAAHSWVTGAHHMFPNQGTGPAINEPHEAHQAVTAQRRAEDLSGPEYRKGEQTLKNYGYGRNPTRELHDVQTQALQRVIGEHAAAGVQESSSQMFYGHARPSSRGLGDLQKTHDEGVMAAHSRFTEGVSRISQHPAFVDATPGMGHRERRQAAMGVMAQATADTSPNTKWRAGERWPNMDQAEESAHAGLEGRAPKFIEGRIQNHQKAADRVADVVGTAHPAASGWPEGSNGESSNAPTGEQFAVHQYGSVVGAPKTVAFRGAMAAPNSPDAYKVSDVHEAGVVLPGASTRKADMYQGPTGKVAHYSDQPASYVKDLEPIPAKPNMSGASAGKKGRRILAGNSRAESMLAESGSTVHALNDRATREVATEHGLSRGVNYADNTHALQGATWGSQQVHRADVAVAHSDQYPVVRDWAAEGHADLTPAGESLFGGNRNLSPQFRANPNTMRQDKTGAARQDVTRNKPYPIMPGE